MRVAPTRIFRSFGRQGRISEIFQSSCPRAVCATHMAQGVANFAMPRAFSSAAGSKIAKILQAELKHENEQYEQAKELKAFLKNSQWKFVEAEGDVNMMLEKEVDEKLVQVEWQLMSPFDPSAEDESEPQREATDFSLTIQSKDKTSGVTFYCSTQAGGDHRYVIGNVRSFLNVEEKDNVSSYNGPEFEDLEEKLQEALDEHLSEMGVDSNICDFIDAMALDKEQREYIRWLQNTLKFIES